MNFNSKTLKPASGLNNPPILPPYLILALAVMAASTAAIFIRLCQAPPLIIGGYRVGLAALITLMLAIYRNKSCHLAIPRREIPYVLVAGFFLSLHFGFWIYSLQLTKVASASILAALQPLFISLMALAFLKEKLNKKDVAGLILSLLGACCISGGDLQLGPSEFKGDMLAILSGACSACYFLVGRRSRHHVELTNYLAAVYGTSACLLILMALFTKTPLTGYPVSAWFWILMLALVPTMIGHSFYNWALKFLTAHKVGMAGYLEPILTSGMAFLFLRETPSLGTYPGALLIFTGIYLTLANKQPAD